MIKKREFIRVLVLSLFLVCPAFANTVKMGYFSEAGMMNGAWDGAVKSGYVYEYVQELASNAGWNYEYVYGSFSDLYDQLLSGEIDMLPYVTKTAKREQQVLFPDLQMGEEQFYIASRKSEQLSSNLKELEGKRVGTIKNAFQNGPFLQLIKEKGVKCQLVEYPLIDDQWVALENGEVDYTIETSTIIQPIDVHAAYKFGESYPFFIIVSKQKKDLFEQLQNAQNNLHQINPVFLDDLNTKYFSGVPLFREIPADGVKWLSEHDKIVIGSYDNDVPYVIQNKDGTYTGIACDQIALMLNALGITVPVEWKLYPGREQALKAMRSGEIDCINPYYHNYADAEKDGVIISQSVYASDFSVLYQDSYTEKTLSVIATPQTRLGAQYVRDNYPEALIIPCQNGYECLDMLFAGKANSVVMYTDALQEIAQKYHKKYVMKNLTADCPVCYSALPQDSGLISIINKSISFVSEKEMADIQNKFNIERRTDNLVSYLFNHPERFWGALAVILAIALSAMFYLRKRDKEYAAKLEENNFLKSVMRRFTSDYGAVIIGNLETGTYKIISHNATIDKIFTGHNTLVEAFNAYVETGVYAPDRQNIDARMIHFNEVRSKLPVGKSDILEYRSDVGNGYVWNEAQMTRIAENEILIGFKENDETISARHVTEKLIGDYAALYIVDLDRDEVRPVKPSESVKAGIFKEKSVYSKQITKFVKIVPEPYKKDWKNFGKPEYLKEYMSKENHREYVYELPETPGSMCRFCVDVIDRVQGEASIVLLSFMNIDDERAQKIMLTRQLADQKVLLDYFVNSYDSAYFVNLADGTFEILHMNHEFSQVFGKSGNTRDVMIKYIDEHIHPDDRPLMMQHIDAQYIKKILKKESNISFIVREIFDGKEKIMRALIVRGTDTEHIAVGFMNITEEMCKEKEAQLKLAESLSFTNFFLDTYVSAYYVNLETLEWQVYKRTEQLEKDYPIGENYYESLLSYINKDVHPDDRDALNSVASPSKMKQLLKKHKEYSHIFRDISGGEEKIYKMQVIRGTDMEHAAYGFMDITQEFHEENKPFFGATSLSKDILAKANVGLWAFELDEGLPPRMYVDDTMLGLIGLDHQVSPEETYHAWYDHIDEGSYDLVNDAVDKMVKGEHAEVQYPWHHPDGHTFVVRCGGVLNPNYVAGVRIEGTHQNVTAVIHYDEQEVERFKRTAIQLQHEQLRGEVLNYLVNNDDDPIELLKNFAEELRALMNCDQVIYRDLEETRIMVNSEGIADTWSVPISYCKQCPHFDAHHKMYSRGYTEMENCQEGWEGIPVYHKCPIKSSLTRIIYCDGKVAGYLAIHYVQDFHKFTEIERSTLEEFARILSMSLSRYKAKIENREMKRYDLLHEIIHSGKWSVFVDAKNDIVKSDFSQSLKPIINNDFTDDYKSWMSLVHPDDKNYVIKAFKDSIADKTCNTPYDVTYRMLDRLGEYNWFHAAGRIVRDENGNGELFGIHINITDQIEEQIEQQHQLEDALIMAQTASQAKTNFLNNMSHDIRTPMNAILGFTDIAKKHLDDTQKVTDSLDKVTSAGEHLLSLINDVLDMSRIESGTVEITPVESNIMELGNEINPIFDTLALEKNIDFQVKIKNVKDPIVKVDRLRMNQVIINVVSNAIKYTNNGGKVVLTATQKKSNTPGFGKYVFTVQDNGIGMSQEFQEHVFETFSREQTATVSKREGTGLGLSIVKRLVDLMGGTITVESEQGVGSTFTISVDLEIVNKAQTETEDSSNTTKLENLHGKRILLVDDNDFNREIARENLADEGVIVEEATNGSDALDKVHLAGAQYFDCILMDVQMPVMNGYEATKQIRTLGEEYKSIPIIALSANAFEEDKQLSKDAGMSAHLSKPIRIKELLETLNRFV